MLNLNPNKCYAQQTKRVTITAPQILPNHWLTDFYALLAVQLKFNDEMKHEVFDYHANKVILLTDKDFFFKELDKHVGAQSSYSLKSQLLESLATLYSIFTHAQTTNEQKNWIASRIEEDVRQCSPGFTNRVNFVITQFNRPQNMDELLAQVGFNLVDRIASQIAAQNPQGIHVHNRVLEVARGAGFGVWPLNTNDIYLHTGSSNLSNEAIRERLEREFSNHFQLFALVNALREQIEAMIAAYGYQGQRELEKEYQQEEYANFYECINLFIPMSMDKLFELAPQTCKVTNINWREVRGALFQKLRDEEYVLLSQEEAALLDGDSKNLSRLLPHAYELAQCLELFREWSMEQKAALALAYLKNKSPNEQKEVLAILHNEAPQLTAQLKTQPNLQAIYFAIAIAEKDIAAVRVYVEQGANIDDALLLLFREEHKRDTFYWLHEHPTLVQKMSAAAMDKVIDQGKYQGKTIAETLVATKTGRQLLWGNDVLQALFSQTSMANKLSDCLKQAQMERNTVNTQVGFFKKPNPLALQLGQYSVYGDLRKSEELLKANPSLLETLLTEKVTVTDYSGRKVKKKTAFQAALCAMDAELCEMLTKYMTQEEIARQYQAIFPKGHETQYQAQLSFEFGQIVDTISNSSKDDIQKALDLDLPNNTKLWRALEQFRADFTKQSYQETVFNPQHLINAFDFYESQFDHWSWEQRDLFWRQVIGYVQRFLPANIAMDFAQGFYKCFESKDKSKRSLNFIYGSGSIFPVFPDSSLSGLGYEYATTGVGQCLPELREFWSVGRVSARFRTYVEQKQQSWETYAAWTGLTLLHA